MLQKKEIFKLSLYPLPPPPRHQLNKPPCFPPSLSFEKFSRLKTHSHDPISRIRFLLPKIGHSSLADPISSFRLCQHLSSFKEECRMKIDHVLYPSIFSKLRISVSKSNFYSVQTVRFSELTKIGSLKSGPVNRSQQYVVSS